MPPSEKRDELARLRQENETLRATIHSLQAQLTELQQQLRDLQKSFEGDVELKKQLADLQEKLAEVIYQQKKRKRQDYGKKTERHNPRQASAESNEQATAGGNGGTSAKNKNHKKNIHLQDLPGKEQVHHVAAEHRLCPEHLVETVPMSHKLTHQLERLSSSIVRLDHKQEVRSCPKSDCDYIITAQKPDAPIPGSLAGPHLLSSVIVDKLADGLPNYRQAKRFMREQAIIPRSTQCDWIIASSFTLVPLYELLKRQVLASRVIKTDDTKVKIQDRKHPDNIRVGKMTPYIGNKATVFDFSPTESFERNRLFLKDFTGFVQCDASNGFDALFNDGTKTELGCNAHSRRKHYEANLVEPLAQDILDIYTELYDIEEKIKGKDPAERLAARQTKSKPLTQKMHEILLTLQQTLNPSNPLAKAVQYTLNHWIALTRFLDDPEFDIDNNEAERAIKYFVLVRKNALFMGSDAGGKAAAIHLSFIASCRQNNIDPLAYLTDVFTRINAMKTSELDQLLPDRWSAARNDKHPP